MKTIALSRDRLLGLSMLVVVSVIVVSNFVRNNVPSVSVEQAKALIDSGAIVIDVRAPEEGMAHIPGAHMIPLEVLSTSLAQFDAVARARPVVVYCGNGSSRGPEAVQILSDNGFAQPLNLEAGFSGWRGAGLPTERG